MPINAIQMLLLINGIIKIVVYSKQLKANLNISQYMRGCHSIPYNHLVSGHQSEDHAWEMQGEGHV